jgi:hypothetical protein
MKPSQHETKMLMIGDLKVKYNGMLTGHLPKKCEMCVQFMALATITKLFKQKFTDM